MVNPDVNTKTLNHRKILRKNAKKQQLTENQKNAKLKYKLIGVRFLHLVCQGCDSPIAPPSVTSLGLWHIPRVPSAWRQSSLDALSNPFVAA